MYLLTQHAPCDCYMQQASQDMSDMQLTQMIKHGQVSGNVRALSVYSHEGHLRHLSDKVFTSGRLREVCKQEVANHRHIEHVLLL